ncbi:MAG: hypothetical protein QG640_260 [Patescibacteria group bacterium]|nr:hypothetical protein [Patescibacteria group bacterium]
MEKFEINEKNQSFELAQELELVEDEEILKEKLPRLLDLIRNDLGVEFSENVPALYTEMQKENCLVRVERLSRVLETMEDDQPLAISDEDETHYANATIALPQGIQLAFSEGQAPGPVRVAIGFGKTIIGFKTDNLSVEEIDFNKDDFRGAEERKFLCRHVVGNLEKKDIRFVVMRIPRTLLPEEYLQEKEKNGKSAFIFRGFKI